MKESAVDTTSIKIQRPHLFINNSWRGSVSGTAFGHSSQSTFRGLCDNSSSDQSGYPVPASPCNSNSVQSGILVNSLSDNSTAVLPSTQLPTLCGIRSPAYSANPVCTGQSHNWLAGLPHCDVNSRSLVSKPSSIQSFVYSSQFSIIGVTKTWLSNQKFDPDILPSQYVLWGWCSSYSQKGNSSTFLFHSCWSWGCHNQVYLSLLWLSVLLMSNLTLLRIIIHLCVVI